jgi:hypothetical protein
MPKNGPVAANSKKRMGMPGCYSDSVTDHKPPHSDGAHSTVAVTGLAAWGRVRREPR